MQAMVLTVIRCVVFVLFSLTVRVKSQFCHGMSQYDRCSPNRGCTCFHIPGAIEVGICGDEFVSCSELRPCEGSDNLCREPGHRCVRHPRCNNVPVCYPVPSFNKQLCPPITTIVTNPTTTIPTTTTIRITTTSATTTQQSVSHSQNVNYQCNFDNDMTGDCQFRLTSGGVNNLAITNGNIPGANPTRPLSDVTSVISLTTPNNEPCNFPYTYTPGNWQMWFCRRYSNTNYSCPTNSGLGQCAMGKFADIRASGSGSYDQTYVTDVKQSSGAIQCLDFYYYIPGTTNNPKIQVGWKADTGTQQIVELNAHSENKWQRFTSSFTAPSSSSYQLTFRMMRDTGSFSYSFGLDEIKIYDQPCGSGPTAIQWRND